MPQAPASAGSPSWGTAIGAKQVIEHEEQATVVAACLGSASRVMPGVRLGQVQHRAEPAHAQVEVCVLQHQPRRSSAPRAR